jgi:hypothetical protein
MGRINTLGVCAAALLAAGCGGMSANECELADWRAVGYEDGSRGRTADGFGGYRRTCAKHGVSPDFETYQAGREAGLREYCQPARGFKEGARGVEYGGACPADLDADFLDSYYEGYTLFELESNVRSTARQIEQNKARMNAIERELTDKTAAVLTDTTTTEQRASLLVETKQLVEERLTLDKEVEALEEELRRRQEELAAHRRHLVTRR